MVAAANADFGHICRKENFRAQIYSIGCWRSPFQRYANVTAIFVAGPPFPRNQSRARKNLSFAALNPPAESFLAGQRARAPERAQRMLLCAPIVIHRNPARPDIWRDDPEPQVPEIGAMVAL